MKYKDAVKQSMEELAKDENVLFLGYNITRGSKAYGTLSDISPEKCIETPVAENLMTGLAIGMAIKKLRPVLFFERHDFMLNALDSLVNHLDKLETMSDNQYKLPVIIRAIVGSNKPINPGPQHIQDFTDIFKKIFSFPVYEPKTAKEVLEAYKEIKSATTPVMIIEKRELYDNEDG